MKEKSQNMQKNCALVEQIANNYCTFKPKSVGSRRQPEQRPKGSTLVRPYRPVRTKGADQKSAELEAQKKRNISSFNGGVHCCDAKGHWYHLPLLNPISIQYVKEDFWHGEAFYR